MAIKEGDYVYINNKKYLVGPNDEYGMDTILNLDGSKVEKFGRVNLEAMEKHGYPNFVVSKASKNSPNTNNSYNNKKTRYQKEQNNQKNRRRTKKTTKQQNANAAALRKLLNNPRGNEWNTTDPNVSEKYLSSKRERNVKAGLKDKELEKYFK